MVHQATPQMPLHVTFKDNAVFEDYLPGNNALAIGTLRQALARLDDHLILIWGAEGVGVSHILQASIHDLQLQGLATMYLPLAECLEFGPEALDGLDEVDAIALDNIELVSGNAQWQEAIFHFYNRMRDSGKMILVGSNCSPMQLPIELPDLKSRLSSGLTLQLSQLDDDQRIDWVIWKARRRGLVVEREVAEFLILRHNQNMKELVATFDKLDTESLAAKRRLTIPFLKQVLAL
ncbi:DnaA regulatory inactivator Hda [Reinekea marina]|uniref:DnaA regulatory inactivator Hda n=1 Tax=Reinekea marina TaxID=1310421 RepID=A0ABV7WT38_9GAMM|nr:DnaA regulatory inactivator Hda [Reinekea marina]MDN3649751.1 DnaA regulatory inactivator Hda [Reinekea marina]